MTFKTPTTVLRLHKKEAALLRPYFQAELDRALATYEKKYHFKLNGPVQVEVYPDHEDFAVRTMGMPGLGALGVTFGNRTSPWIRPAARKPGQFHWDSTMWHELSHVYVLAMTNSRVPRWFTEGLAVYRGNRQRQSRLGRSPGSGSHQRHQEQEAAADCGSGSRLHSSHVSGAGDRVVFSGRQDLQLHRSEMGLRQAAGDDPRFRRAEPTPQVIEKEFKMKPEEFDKQFLAWLDAQTKSHRGRLRRMEEAASRHIRRRAKAKKWDDVIKEGDGDSRSLSGLRGGRQRVRISVRSISGQGRQGQSDGRAGALRENRRARSRYAEAAGARSKPSRGTRRTRPRTLERLNLIYLERRRGAQEAGRAVHGFGQSEGRDARIQAVLARPPVDLAGAHYQLARALQAAHRTDEARDEVVSALEAAPGFKPAQKLLLELNVKE